MASLEDYLASEYLAYRQDMTTLARAISDATQMFLRTSTPKGWPYVCKASGDTDEPKTVSHGTMAMVLTAVGRAIGLCSTTSGAFSRFVNGPKLDDLVLANLKVLADDMAAHLRSGKSERLPLSTSFGPGNPLTVSHIVDLLVSLDSQRAVADLGAPERDRVRSLSEEIASAIKDAASSVEDIISGTFDSQDFLVTASEGENYYRNAFIPLRTVRAARDLVKIGLGGDLDAKLITHRLFFEATLHEQLSFSAIPDSRFDAAELVFSLEGLVLCAKEAVDSTLFCRVLEVLEEKQNTSAHWRPSKPFLAASTGAIFLPLSVEVANSLMRSIAIMDHGRTHDTYTSKSIPLIKRFWSWLQARAVRLLRDGVNCLGWHSEHINAPDLVHPWDTSLVVEFMIGYHELLEREIQTSTLQLSGLQWNRPGRIDPSAIEIRWAGVVAKMEPSLGRAQEEQVYWRIGEDFVKGWASGKPGNYSMLLYGPPGTGKTSVADNLSEQLGMPLITVTVSDFLGRGGANVENRAKAIFQTLEHQRDVIILFDEIDSFLLDRDSKFYREQDSLFQFLTPGMLTKFNNLRKAKRCIFIIATNYENRIDPAIKRTGRIDQSYLLPLPDSARRKKILENAGLPDGQYTTELQRASVMFGFGDLVKAAKAANGDPAAIIQALKKAPRSTSFDAYLRRHEAEPADLPIAELNDLIRLSGDAGGCDELDKLKEDERWKKVQERLSH
ncbi:ATP-binding protein [Sinorhizobium meliloti]|uniref:ATP-binding protein n=1 Tax=Rhizobium meliloti TaxID=382 RepID=UPI00299EBE3D|nr:AAA family ATPase [Sinorhizobium meliloti]MDW9865066.1 AAA family ATPase [Sinorhizobium meliloti]